MIAAKFSQGAGRGVGSPTSWCAHHRHLGQGQGQDAAHARQVPLPLQPARPLARLPGHLPVRAHETSPRSALPAQAVEARVQRVFSDKLIDHKDKAGSQNRRHARGHFRRRLGTVARHVYSSTTCARARTRRRAKAPRPRCTATRVELKKVTVQYMNQFNESYKLLGWTSSSSTTPRAPDAHHAPLLRSRAAPRSSSAWRLEQQSLTRLGAFICKAPSSRSRSRRRTTNNLLEDFKPLYRRAGVQGKAVFLSPTRRSRTGLPRVFNIFLSTGELPNLFPRDELDASSARSPVYESIFKGRADAGRPVGLLHRPRRSNLPCRSASRPCGPKFRTRAQQFPAHQRLHDRLVPPWPSRRSPTWYRLIGSFDRLQGDAQRRRASSSATWRSCTRP